MWPVILIIIAIVIWLFSRHEKERTGQFNQIADRMGLRFYPKGDGALLEKLLGFPLFSQGHSKKVSNMLHGVPGQLGGAGLPPAGVRPPVSTPKV